MYGAPICLGKFKIAIAVPPENDMDVFSKDFGLIAIVEDGKLIGFNVAIGGGMGMLTVETSKCTPQLAKVNWFL